jgi:glycosyltransferase involved in cell wall biosynthesis
MLSRCLDSISQSGYANCEVLVLENNSEQAETLAFYRRMERERRAQIVAWNKPFNYAAVNNFGAAHARGDVLLFLNNDVEAINPDWLELMVKHALRPEVGAVGAKLYYPDDTIQHAGIVVGMGGIAGHATPFARKGIPWLILASHKPPTLRTMCCANVRVRGTAKRERRARMAFCPECGADLGELERCDELFGQALAWEWLDPPRSYANHHLLVLSWEIQHPSRFSEPALAWARDALRHGVREGIDPEQLRREAAYLSRQRRDDGFRIVREGGEVVPRKWARTFADVVAEGSDAMPESVMRLAEAIVEELEKEAEAS